MGALATGGPALAIGTAAAVGGLATRGGGLAIVEGVGGVGPEIVGLRRLGCGHSSGAVVGAGRTSEARGATPGPTVAGLGGGPADAADVGRPGTDVGAVGFLIADGFGSVLARAAEGSGRVESVEGSGGSLEI